MKVLVVTPWVPSAIRPRSLGIINALRIEHQVGIVAMTWSDAEAAALENLGLSYTQSIPMSSFRGLLNAATHIPSRKSLQQSWTTTRKAAASISKAMQEFSPDAALYCVLRTAQYRPSSTALKNWIDLDEFRSGYYAQRAQSAVSWLSKLIARSEAKRMRAEESRIVSDFDRVLVSSPFDLDDRFPNVRLVRTANTLLGSFPDVPKHSPKVPTVLFVGRLDYEANVEALEWYVRNVWPLVVERVPLAQLTIVGAHPSQHVKSLQSAISVRIYQDVESVVPYYCESSLAIAPVVHATGVQMKVIEGLGFGTPMVVSSRAARGAGLTNGVECLVANEGDVSQWVESTVRLLSDTALAESLGEAGKQWAMANHSVDSCRSALFAALGICGSSGQGLDA